MNGRDRRAAMLTRIAASGPAGRDLAETLAEVPPEGETGEAFAARLLARIVARAVRRVEEERREMQ